MIATDSPFRCKNFVRMWIAQTLAQTSNRVFQIAVVWWMMTELKGEMPGLYTAVFLVGCALPAVLLAKPIGQWVDKLRLNLLMGQALTFSSIVLLVAFLFLSHLGPIPFLLLGSALAFAHAIFDPSVQRALSQLVPSGSISKAVSIVTATQSAANFGGAFLGAFLLDKLGFGPLVLIAALAYGISSGLSYSLGLSQVKDAPVLGKDGVVAESKSWSLRTEYPLIARILIGFAIVNFFATPILIVLPLYVSQVLNGSAFDLSILDAGIWIGVMAGTFFAFQVTGRLSPLKTAAVCLGVMGFAFAAPGVIANKWVYLSCLLLAGFALGANNTRFVTLFQESIAEEYKGRFFALLQATVSFTVPISFLAFGFLGDIVSPQHLCILQGISVAVLAGYFFFLESASIATEPVAPVALETE